MLVRVEMDSDWLTRICRWILAEQNFLQNRDMVCKLGAITITEIQSIGTLNIWWEIFA